MRYAPKFLGPWERIDRMIDDRCAEAHAEIKRMAAAAIESVGPKRIIRSSPYDNQLWALANAGMQNLGGMQAMSQEALHQRAILQAQGMTNCQSGQWSYGGVGITGLVASVFGE